MSYREWTPGFLLLLFSFPVMAQVDIERTCRSHAATATETEMSDVTSRLGERLDNGNTMISWDARQAGGRVISGFCETDPTTGRIVRFQTNPLDSGNAAAAGMISESQAQRICQSEARQRLNSTTGDVTSWHDRGGPGHTLFWRYRGSEGQSAEGSCRINMTTGRVERFETTRQSGFAGDASARTWSGGDMIRANMVQRAGDGKCTFEVQVDGAAELDIRGDQGRLRTLSGTPATWNKLECNRPLPENPTSFRLSAIGGRGRQELMRDPNSNQGVAVIRIEDTRGGSRRQRGEITWGGANAAAEGAWDTTTGSMRDCRTQASRMTNVPLADVDVRRMGTMENGNYRIAWDTRGRSGRVMSGFCEADPSTNRIVRFESNAR